MNYTTTLLCATFAACPFPVGAAEFSFGRNANGIGDQSSAQLTSDGFTLSIAANPTGAVFDERGSGGLGINSRGISGVSDGSLDKFDVISGPGPIGVQGESVTFSFDLPGVLTGIDFDGVKDESLEYFFLTTPGGERINFFDSAANTTVPGAVDAAISAGGVPGEVVYLLEVAGGPDDEATGLSFPFAAGEEFTITYAELGAQFGPIDTPNGARLQGLTVANIPEPTPTLLMTTASVVLLIRRRGS